MSAFRAPFVVALSCSLAALAHPSIADACGGFFCSSGGPQPLQAVEQTQERVLFQVNDDETITATVEISYTGDPALFAWVVPVPDEPTLELGSLDGIVALDQATQPTFVAPRTVCGADTTGCRPSVAQTLLNGAEAMAQAAFAVPVALTGCAESGLVATPSAGLGGVGVDVVDLDRVGPFEPEVVSSDDPELLINWLNSNEFLITEAMRPAIEGYVEAGMKFLAMKLAPDAEVGDIEPIRMTYPATTPMLPIVLTQVAAEPDMSIVVFIGADQRYQAADWPNLVVDPADIWIDPTIVAGTNYSSMVSWMADELGGRAWITEFAGARPGATGVSELTDSPYITRLFTRLSGWEMTDDPMFVPSDGHDIDNLRDLSLGAAQDICDVMFGQGSACGGVYCGEGARCADMGGVPGCVCGEGQVARAVLQRGLGQLVPKVVCTRTDFDMMEGMPDGLATPPDPCANVSCGTGTCRALNGFATCLCDEGTAATLGFGQGMTCQPFDGELMGPEAMLPTWVDDGVNGLAEENVNTRFFMLLGLLVPVGILRRRYARR